jgi:hypothetical protein
VLPTFRVGDSIVVEERWHGLPWSAEPHRVVASSLELMVTWMPAGTVAVRASNRGLPGTEHLSREQRKLTALAERRVKPIETVESPDKLYWWRPDRWSRVNLGWHPDTGDFMGWYVNFEQPVAANPTGVWGKDLVLDLLVAPDGTFSVKDQADFDEAIDRGIVSAELRGIFAAETESVLAELHERSGPFDLLWTSFRPDSDWADPQLPPSHALNGSFWEKLQAL